LLSSSHRKIRPGAGGRLTAVESNKRAPCAHVEGSSPSVAPRPFAAGIDPARFSAARITRPGALSARVPPPRRGGRCGRGCPQGREPPPGDDADVPRGDGDAPGGPRSPGGSRPVGLSPVPLPSRLCFRHRSSSTPIQAAYIRSIARLHPCPSIPVPAAALATTGVQGTIPTRPGIRKRRVTTPKQSKL